MQIGCDLIFVQKREHFVLFQFGQGEDRGREDGPGGFQGDR